MSFLEALRCENKGTVPVWMMRQAGRYLPEYQELRKGVSLGEMFHDPVRAAKATLQPIERFGMDAAILYSDLPLVVEGFGARVEYHEGFGPLIKGELGELGDVGEIFSYVGETIERVKETLTVPLIGFVGAPFTVASYLLREEKGDVLKGIKKMLHSEPDRLGELLDRLCEGIIALVEKQIEWGVDVVQIFDSWAGELSGGYFADLCIDYLERIVERIRGRVPVILFCRGSGWHAKELSLIGADAISIDWTRNLWDVRAEVSCALQGNLDPFVLLGSKEGVVEEVTTILSKMGNDPGWIFNLGHGVLPDTPVENVEAMVKTLRSQGVKFQKREGSPV